MPTRKNHPLRIEKRRLTALWTLLRTPEEKRNDRQKREITLLKQRTHSQ